MHFLCSISVIFLLAFVNPISAEATNESRWSESQRATLQGLSLYNLKPYPDTSNQYVNNRDAISLGKRLFHEPLLSRNKKVSCSTCHIEAQSFTDNKLIAIGARVGLRNTPTLFNVGQQDWFFWDGRADSLWAQALSPLEDPAEHNFTRTELFHFITSNKNYKIQYEQLFNEILPSLSELSNYPQKAGPKGSLSTLKAWKKLTKSEREQINRVFSNIGKAIAAYVSTIKSVPTRFDNFVSQLLEKGYSSLFTASEERGLKLFISSQAGCINCHSGAIFSNKSFHNIGTGIRGKDNGRSEIVDSIIHDTFNCLSPFSDAAKDQCLELKYLNRNRHALAGSFKTPTLRGISSTAPYMHDGRYHTLKDVLAHYANIDKDNALLTDLPEMSLSKQQQKDIISFLLTL